MPIIITFPSAEEEDRARRFQVHKNYIGAIAQFLQAEYGEPGLGLLKSLVRRQRDSGSYRRIQARTVDRERLSQYLHLAWSSEIQFRLSELADRNLLQYSNAWAPIHVYYAIYMAAQGWFTCLGASDLIDNHTGSLNTLSNQITQRNNLFPMPWRVTCTGCPQLGEAKFHHFPEDIDIDGPVEVLSNPSLDSFWPRYGKLLETTRRRRLQRNLDEWKRRNNRQRMFAGEKREVEEGLLPTTLFDFFWRLRVRSNYRDVRSFLSSGVGTDWQEEFRDGMEVVLEATMILLESLISVYAGPHVYERIIEEFVEAQRDLPELRGPFEARLEALRN